MKKVSTKVNACTLAFYSWSVAYNIYVFLLNISSPVLKIYPVLLFSFLEDAAEVAVCRRSVK